MDIEYIEGMKKYIMIGVAIAAVIVMALIMIPVAVGHIVFWLTGASGVGVLFGLAAFIVGIGAVIGGIAWICDYSN